MESFAVHLNALSPPQFTPDSLSSCRRPFTPPNLSSHSDFLRLTNDIPRMNDTRDPAEDAKRDVDEEISGATTLHGDGEEWDPYCEEVEEDC